MRKDATMWRRRRRGPCQRRCRQDARSPRRPTLHGAFVQVQRDLRLGNKARLADAVPEPAAAQAAQADRQARSWHPAQPQLPRDSPSRSRSAGVPAKNGLSLIGRHDAAAHQKRHGKREAQPPSPSRAPCPNDGSAGREGRGTSRARRWGEGPPRVLQARSVRRSCPSAGPSPHRRAQAGFYPAHDLGRRGRRLARSAGCKRADKHRCHGTRLQLGGERRTR